MKYETIYTILNYTEHFLVLVSTITGCIWISVFSSLHGIPTGIKSSVIGLNICAIAAGILKYKSIIKKKKKKRDNIFLSKNNLNRIGVLNAKSVTNSYVSHGEFVLVNSVLK